MIWKTDKGRKELETEKSNWKIINSIISQLWQPRLT